MAKNISKQEEIMPLKGGRVILIGIEAAPKATELDTLWLGIGRIDDRLLCPNCGNNTDIFVVAMPEVDTSVPDAEIRLIDTGEWLAWCICGEKWTRGTEYTRQ